MLDKKILIVKIMEIKMHTNSTRNDPSINESFLAEKLKHHFLSFSLFPLFFFPSTPISSPFSLFFFNFFFSIFPLPLFLVLSFSTRLLSLFLSFFPVAIFCCLIHTKTIVCEKCNTELKKKGHYQVYILASRIMHA